MSLLTFCWFALSSACIAVSITLDPSGIWDVALKSGSGVFGLLFIVSLMLGRRIKFDPVLR